MITIKGLCNIEATVLKDSVSPQGIRLLTLELTYPRIIHAEVMTHRMLSRNAASSRAIPFEKMVQNLHGRPVRFGQNVSGMQDKGEDFAARVTLFKEQGVTQTPEVAWEFAKQQALFNSQRFHDAGYHKQVVNRLTEPFQLIKVVATATEWSNFLWLRDHGAVDPSLAELARCIREAGQASEPMLLQPGEWHLPYVATYRYNGALCYYITDENDHKVELTLEQAKAVSAARCAAVSFRNVDYGLEKSEQVFARLVGDDRKHASAFEHQGTPMKPATYGETDDQHDWNLSPFTHTWENGVSHMDREGQLWSGNLRGWIQFRKLIAGENFVGGF